MDLTFDDVERMAGDGSDEKITAFSRRNNNVSFEIIEVYGKLSEKKGAAVFSMVNWNGHIRYDLRKWNEEMSQAYKGVTFNDQEIEKLREIDFSSINLNSSLRSEYTGEKAKAKIYDRICLLSYTTEKDVVWNKEVNIVDWGYGKKIGIRKWSEDYSKCGKGICITLDEFKVLKTMVDKLEAF